MILKPISVKSVPYSYRATDLVFSYQIGEVIYELVACFDPDDDLEYLDQIVFGMRT